jgi:hypothetical protein
MNVSKLIKKAVALSGASLRLVMGAASAAALVYAGMRKRKGRDRTPENR